MPTDAALPDLVAMPRVAPAERVGSGMPARIARRLATASEACAVLRANTWREALAPLRALPATRRTQREHDAALATAIAWITGEPEARAAALLRASQRGNRAFQDDYDLLARSPLARARLHIARVQLAAEPEFATALGQLDRPLVLACTHSGPFVSALLRLLPRLPGASRVTLIARPAPSEREHAVRDHARALGVDIDVLRLHERPLLPALQALREGRVVVVMADVPPSFWQTTNARQSLASCELFGQPARLPDGPAALAVAADAVVLPLYCTGTAAAPRVQVGALVDARRADETRVHATRRVHETLARHVAGWLRDAGDAWLLWRHLPAYFVSPDTFFAAPDTGHRQRQREKSGGGT